MHTDRFSKLRKDFLSDLFSKKTVTSVWRKIVRDQLRSLDFKDLYDNYDFNYNIEERATAISNEILSGTYRPSLPLIYKLEKKYGICRHIVMPQPIDALILQILVESVADQIIKHQPSDNSFYSRDKNNVGKSHDAANYVLSFRRQWKKLQQKIYRFNNEKSLLIVTDLSNYYDSISVDELRKVFLGYVENNEVLVDILFNVIEEISWKPDYLPYSGKGLPTSNLEAIRLLAHSFLFEIDDVLKQRTQDFFTRWMDDIVIGVDDRKEAIELISSISDMLKSRGLALNLSKTAIYDRNEAHYHFQINENKYLDSLEDIRKGDSNYNKETVKLKKQFKKHFNDHGPKYWDKIAKRYITAFGKLESTTLLTEISKVYLNYPELRPNLLMYLKKIGYRKQTARKVKEIFAELDVFDDISCYQICELVTTWEVPTDNAGREFLQNINHSLIDRHFKKNRKNPADFYSILWFKVKYDYPEELLIFIKQYQNMWQADSFLRRQVTAALGRLLIFNRKDVESLLYSQISSGITNTVSLANQIQNFSKIDGLDSKLRFYLFPKNIQQPYPLSKFMVLCSVMNSEKVRTNDKIRKSALAHIKDPYYRMWLNAQYNIH